MCLLFPATVYQQEPPLPKVSSCPEGDFPAAVAWFLGAHVLGFCEGPRDNCLNVWIQQSNDNDTDDTNTEWKHKSLFQTCVCHTAGSLLFCSHTHKQEVTSDPLLRDIIKLSLKNVRVKKKKSPLERGSCCFRSQSLATTSPCLLVVTFECGQTNKNLHFKTQHWHFIHS